MLVTGLPRSGTTVIGTVLAARARTVSLYEPMNGQSGDRRFASIFPMPGAAGFEPADLDAFLADLAELRLDLRPGVFPHERGLRAAAKRIAGSRSRASLRAARLRPWADTLVWKDPFALLCVPALVERGVCVVAAYRPPAAIAASFKRLHWTYDVATIEAGLRGVAEWPLPPRAAAEGVGAETAVAVWLWSLFAQMWLWLGPRAPRLVATGDLASTPAAAFAEIAAGLGWEPDPRRDRAVARQFRTGGPAVPQGHPHSRDRDPAQVNDYWRQVLSPAEVSFVASATATLEAALQPMIWRPAR